MFSWNRLFLSLFGSRLLTCLLALFLFSTRSLSLFNLLSFSFQLAPFCFSTCALSLFNLLSLVFQLALFRLPGVFLTCLVVLFRSTPFFFIFSVISVLSFANLHINNVTCKLFCCFLTTNPNSCFAVICILFPLFLMSFCVSSSFSVFCALLSPFSSVLFSIPFLVFLFFFFFLEYLSLSFFLFSPVLSRHIPPHYPLEHLAFLGHLSLSLPSSSLLCAPTRPPASHV